MTASLKGKPITADQIEQYRGIAASYDRRVRAGERLRKQAFAEFDLRVGDVVLDVGCGTGLSFPLIEEAIGPSGRLVGIEQSPDMLALARARVQGAGCSLHRQRVNALGVAHSTRVKAMPHPPLGDRHISRLGDLQHVRPWPSERQTRDSFHVIGAEMGIPLGHRQLSVPELGGRVDEIGCFQQHRAGWWGRWAEE